MSSESIDFSDPKIAKLIAEFWSGEAKHIAHKESVLWDPNHIQCYCGKFQPKDSLNIIDTGVIQVIDVTCKDCAELNKDKAIIVCCGCHVPVVWVDPHKEKNGFEFKKGKYYHTRACPTCDEGITSSTVLEQVLYCKKMGIPYASESKI